MANVIVVKLVHGNTYDAAHWANENGLADDVIQIDGTLSNHTKVIMRMSESKHRVLVDSKVV